jgi:ribosomal protein L37E
MGRPLQTGTHGYRGYTIVRRHYETASVFKDGTCIACGFSTIQRARQWVDEQLKGQDHDA